MANARSFPRPIPTNKAVAPHIMRTASLVLDPLHPAPHISITPENTDRTQVPSTSLPLAAPLEVA